MNRMQKKELDFMSQMTHDNFIYNQSSSTPTGFVQPQLPFISQAEYPEIKRRLENCGSAENYQKCFRSGSSSSYFATSHLNNDKDNYDKCDDDDDEKKEKLCQACHDFCPQEEMRSGFVGSGVFLQLQAGSSSSASNSNESNPSHAGHSNLNYFVHDPKVIPPLGRNVNWQGTWDNKCKNTQFPTKPYQINY